MQIRTKLAFRFALIVGSILVIFSLVIYALFSNNRRQEFYSVLRARALTTAKLYSKDVQEITYKLLKVIDRNSINAFPDEKIVIYNEIGMKVYSNPDDKSITFIPQDILNKIKLKKEIHYEKNGDEVIGVLYQGTNEKLVVVASGYDEYGYHKLFVLAEILVTTCFCTIVVIGITGFLFARQALKPVNEMVMQAEHISASSLSTRLHTGNGADEMARLAITFNNMLNRLEQAFALQRSFVSNASHELRTPLTAMTGQLEVALISERDTEEYRRILTSVLEDVKDLNSLTNGLIELNQAGMDEAILKLHPLRIDELLWQAKADLLKRNSSYKATVEVKDFPDDESNLTIYGNHLLKAAMLNIMDNACKFSPGNEVHILFEAKKDIITISFTDRGIGISEEDIKKIFQPFYRGSNASQFRGYGIGLALTIKIIQLHKGAMQIESEINKYTKVTIQFPVDEGKKALGA